MGALKLLIASDPAYTNDNSSPEMMRGSSSSQLRASRACAEVRIYVRIYAALLTAAFFGRCAYTYGAAIIRASEFWERERPDANVVNSNPV